MPTQQMWRRASAQPRTITAGLTLFCIILCAPAAVAADASGTFAVRGSKEAAGTIRPSHAAAFVTRDVRNPKLQVIEVVLSELPLDAAAAAASIDPHTDAINQKALMRHNYVLLWVRPDGEVSMNATFGATMTQYLDKVGERLRATLTSNTPERVAGRVFTTRPLETMDGQSYTLDLTFSAEVSRLPAGRALASGGAEPGKALLAIIAAATAKNWAAIEAASSPARSASSRPTTGRRTRTPSRRETCSRRGCRRPASRSRAARFARTRRIWRSKATCSRARADCTGRASSASVASGCSTPPRRLECSEQGPILALAAARDTRDQP